MSGRAKRILVDRAPGSLRALCFAPDGQAYRGFHQAFEGQNEPVRYGQIIQVRVRERDQSGGFFLDHIGWKLWQGGHEPIFCDRRHSGDLAEGLTLTARVVSGRRRDHAARVIPVEDILKFTDPAQAFVSWLSVFEGAPPEEVSAETKDMFEEAWESARATTLPLKGGGAIHIERTRALTAIDVDTGARVTKGSAGARALSLNTLALKEVARQVSLRDLGGAIVVDCVGPLNEAGRDKLKSVFLNTWKAYSDRKVEIIRPSRFGLMEISLPWQATPVGDMIDFGEQALLSALRMARQELQRDAGGFCKLHLSQAAYDAYLCRKMVVDQLVNEAFHGRLTLVKAVTGQEGLERQCHS